MKNSGWRIKDLIDLEYFLRSDEREEEFARIPPDGRDREIYLKYIQPYEHEKQPLHPKEAIQIWLERRRDMEQSETGSKTVLPGEAFDEIYRLLGFGFLIGGILAGSGLAFSFLVYRGTEPLNVSLYLGSFVFTQLFLLILFQGMSLIRKWRRVSLQSSPIYSLISGLAGAVIMRIRRHTLKTLSGSRRHAFEAVMGLVRGKNQIYGSLFFWPVFLQAQVFMIGFNLGLAGATLLKVMGSDVAFGWQSTVQVSARWVFETVKVIALPWSWLAPPGIAYPSLSQIEGSHMVLKEGIYRLATENLVSWWPFLILAVLCYGLLPRLILLIAGLVFQKRALHRIDFGYSACEKLLHRMRAPLVSTEGRRPVAPEPIRCGDRIPETAPPAHEEPFAEKVLIALIPHDIFESCPEDELERVAFRNFGYHVGRKWRFGEDEAGDQRIFDEISSIKEENTAPDILVLQEAWQPPIKENIRFIRDLRKALGKTAKIKVGLIGRPRPDHFFSQMKEAEWKVWHQKIKALGDPYLELERLVLNDRRQDS